MNLHKHLWSITVKGKVVEHTPCYALTDVTFLVRETARQQVIAKKCRAVHAWMEGEKAQAVTAVPTDALEVHYNPYRAGTFTLTNGTAVTAAKAAWFIGRKAYIRI